MPSSDSGTDPQLHARARELINETLTSWLSYDDDLYSETLSRLYRDPIWAHDDADLYLLAASCNAAVCATVLLARERGVDVADVLPEVAHTARHAP